MTRRAASKDRFTLTAGSTALSVLLGLLCAPPLRAQPRYAKSSLELRVDSLVAALRSQGVGSICVVESYCVGCRGSYLSDTSPCATKGILVPTYVFWQAGAVTRAAYLDNCSLKKAVELRRVTFWQYLSDHKQALTEGELEHFTIVEDGKLERIRRNHGGHYSYRFLLGQDTIAQSIDEFDVSKQTSFQRTTSRNVYYRQNKHNPIWVMTSRLDLAIAEAEKAWSAGQN